MVCKMEYEEIEFVCESCGKKGKYLVRNNGVKVWNIDWANINNHDYKRDRKDYRGLCRKCHIRYDNVMKDDLLKL